MQNPLTRSELFLSALAGMGFVVGGLGMATTPKTAACTRAAHVRYEDRNAEAGDDEEESIDPAQLPESVLATAQRTFGGVAGLKASREVDAGTTLYEVEGEIAGRQVSIKCAENGLIHELEREISGAELPRDAAAGIQKLFPGARLVSAESIEVHWFEAQLEIGGERREVAVGVSGRVRSDESGDDEEDEDDQER